VISTSPTSAPAAGGAVVTILGANLTVTNEALVVLTSGSASTNATLTVLNNTVASFIVPAFTSVATPFVCTLAIALNGQQLVAITPTLMLYGSCGCVFLQWRS
jgi:hypothetical protein